MSGDSQVAQLVKNLPASVEDTRDTGSIPGSGRSPEGGHGIPLRILAWRIHTQRSLEGYSPWSCKESDTTEHLPLLTLSKQIIFQSVWASSSQVQALEQRRGFAEKEFCIKPAAPAPA